MAARAAQMTKVASGFYCPRCGGTMRVLESRGPADPSLRVQPYVWRRRRCEGCGFRVRTTETICRSAG